ncbi:MAG TPA: hypothetical protein ENG63_07810 [Candidatus Desulfofervidus auxilii]|uniref:Class III cytochrome C domain-containing protein n=1 Tax=Desulfofervidus auxilii TaxID=1621989 RepID=A0A7C0Y368_DESA2|nr:hypothetical protein [Candidatus Desulfofervidus auxilii]
MKIKCWLLLILAIIFSIVFKTHSQPVSAPPELLKIRDSGFAKFGPYKYPPVSFSHELHAGLYRVKCSTCHHLYENGKNVWTPEHGVQECSDCHGKSKTELTVAYHMKCWGCHERLEGIYLELDAPINQCFRCHLKNIEVERIRIHQKLKKTNKKLMDAIKQLELKGFYK